jgi:hypothetical protein
MKEHPDGGLVDSIGDHYVFVGRELRKLGETKTNFESRSTHSLEAMFFQEGVNWYRNHLRQIGVSEKCL